MSALRFHPKSPKTAVLMSRRPTGFPGKLGGGSAPVVYVRTAFVSSTGNDGTAQMNNPALPWLTEQAALTTLAAAYAGQAVTLRYLTNISGTNLTVASSISGNLTIRGHGATRSTNSIFGVGNSVVDITLHDMDLSGNVSWSDNTATTATDAGIVRGIGSATLQLLYAIGAEGAAGSNGAGGGTAAGDNGADGADGDPPGTGSDAPIVDESGDAGGHGGNAGFGRSGIVAGTLGVAQGFFSSQVGGTGGTGGNGGTATGGTGGNGGNSTSLFEQDGGNAGNGGQAYAIGGNAGNGGNGGNGGSWARQDTADITQFNSGGGDGGAAGVTFGAGGAATGGAGGTGGDPGLMGGNQGADGNVGASSNVDGSAGVAGNAGLNGTLT